MGGVHMKISFSGSHGTGKTTSVYELAYKMKIKNPGKRVGVFIDSARNSPFGFNNKNKPKIAQSWIFLNQLKSELELSTKFDILITDRTIFDSIAYTYVFGQEDLADDLLSLGLHYMNSYDKIIFKTIANNNYLIKEGEDRDVYDLQYRQKVENKLLQIYKHLQAMGGTFEFEKI